MFTWFKTLFNGDRKKQWSLLRPYKHGSIEYFYLFKCLACHRIAPCTLSEGPATIGYMFCIKCGDIFEYSLWDAELTEAAAKRQSQSYKSTYGEIRFLDCKCGGDILTTARLKEPCVYCGHPGTTYEIRSLHDIGKFKLHDYPEYIEMSPWEYLLSHEIHKLDTFVERLKGQP